jgi:hypothetical protein
MNEFICYANLNPLTDDVLGQGSNPNHNYSTAVHPSRSSLYHRTLTTNAKTNQNQNVRLWIKPTITLDI